MAAFHAIAPASGFVCRDVVILPAAIDNTRRDYFEGRAYVFR